MAVLHYRQSTLRGSLSCLSSSTVCLAAVRRSVELGECSGWYQHCSDEQCPGSWGLPLQVWLQIPAVQLGLPSTPHTGTCTGHVPWQHLCKSVGKTHLKAVIKLGHGVYCLQQQRVQPQPAARNASSDRSSASSSGASSTGTSATSSSIWSNRAGCSMFQAAKYSCSKSSSCRVGLLHHLGCQTDSECNHLPQRW